jgi:5-methylcytosine-specific restriction enzyme subunit McrC
MSKIKKSIIVFEHDYLWLHKKNRNNECLSVEQLTALQEFYGEKGVPYYNLVHQGVKFREYVGVLQIGDLTVEILPKTERNTSEANKEIWRKRLIEMLQSVGLIQVATSQNADLQVKSNSILDLYFKMFVEEVEYLMHKGLIRKYRKKEGNITALKGQLKFAKHIQRNYIHQERFFVRHSTYDKEHLIHQILLKTLSLLKRINKYQELQSRIGRLLIDFPEVSDINVQDYTFQTIKYNRKNEHYKKAIKIAELILLNYHPDIIKGQRHVLALMFNMNTLWESFVYQSLQKYSKDDTVKSQIKQDFWKYQEGRSASLYMKADIIINPNDDSNCIVLDTKWKNIGNGKPSHSDVRQLYAYLKYYKASKVALIYPGAENSIKTGKYYNELSKELGKLECAVIQIAPKETIDQWQKAIVQTIQKWNKTE